MTKTDTKKNVPAENIRSRQPLTGVFIAVFIANP
jgi:hypothetical protein